MATYQGAWFPPYILKSEIAVRRSVQIIRAFTALESMALSSESGEILQMIASQSRMITVLADEMYRNRQRIDTHDAQIKSLSLKIDRIESPKTISPSIVPIS